MGKHAFLIMAHKDDLSYRTLLKQIDDDNSDIFIHMDSKNKNYNPNEISKLVRRSKVFHVQRTNVIWGGYSQITCELLLLTSATKVASYDYYHLLSGQDLLIDSIQNIYEFTNKNNGMEFVQFESSNFIYGDRVHYYSIQEKVGRTKGILYFFDRILRILQKIFKIKRNRNIEFYMGANWFSITDDLARYVLSKKDWIDKVFKYTLCADEIFIQTIVHNSDFKNKLYVKEYNNSSESILRLIDWNRGRPYIFRNSDFKEIIEDDMFFARKFDEEIDSQIIKSIYKYYN